MAGFWERVFAKGKESDSAADLLARLLRSPAHEVRSAMTSLDLWRELYGGTNTSSGAQINAVTALQASVAYACARKIANGMSQIPFRLMRSEGDTREPAMDHPLYPLLTRRPNDWMTPAEMWDMLGLHLVFVGNAYVLLLRSRSGSIIELLPLQPSWVKPELDDKNWVVSYTLSMPDQIERKIPARDMWHLKGPTWNGWMGLDGVQLAREAIGLAVSQEETAGSSVKNGTRLQGFLTTDQTLDAKQRKDLRDSWAATYAGAENANKVGVLSNGMKFSPMSMTMNDAQFIDQRKFQVEEVCRAFDVQPIMIGHTGDKANTYASAEQLFLSHVVHTMGPWYARIESSANAALLTDAEARAGYYTKFFVQALLRGASADRAEFYTKLYGIGVMNPNEIRNLEDLNPYEGGDRYAVPLNMISPDLADEVQEGTEEDDVPPQPMSGASQGSAS